jgi:hypothetical protein
MKIENALSCNCSICSKRGSLLAFAPETAFKLVKGEKDLTDYLFGAKTIHHYFCSTCGILPFGAAMNNGQAMRAINIRTLDDFDFEKVPVTHYDGKHI